MSTLIQLRRGTASEWSAANPILAPGEFGVAIDTSAVKVGDGVTAWSALGALGAGVYEPIISTLGAAKGGTGIASYTVGDLLFASGATALSKLADVAVGSVLVSGGVGVAPAWSASPSLTGIPRVSVDSLGVTSTDGLVLQNTTPAALGVQQWSPRLRLRGNGWGTTASASQTIDFKLDVQPLQSAAPFTYLSLDASLNGAAYVNHWVSYQAAASVLPNFLVGGNLLATGSSGNAFIGFGAANPLLSFGVPSLSSGFGTSPALVSGRVSAFRWNVGTGGVATTGVITFGGTAAVTGWNCTVNDLANAATTVTVQTASTTTTASFAAYSRTTGLPVAWVSGAVLAISAVGF